MANPLDYLSRELDSLKAQGLYRRLRVLEDEQKPKATFDHRTVVNLSSNNYLGLANDEWLKTAALTQPCSLLTTLPMEVSRPRIALLFRSGVGRK